MRNPRLTIVFCCLASLPLIGCAAGPPVVWQPEPSSSIAASAAPQVYAMGPAAPAAILVILPGADGLGEEPALWAARGFDVVAAPPDMLWSPAGSEAAVARMIASAQALADAPVWLLGPGPAIDAAIAAGPSLGQGQVSGVVVTTLAAGTATCSRSVTYVDPGNGAKPRVTVKTSGNACGPGATAGTAARPRDVSPIPQLPAKSPKIIEASAKGNAAAAARQQEVEQVAALIKAAAG